MTDEIDWSEYPDWYADVIERAAVWGCPEAAIINSHIQWQAERIAYLTEKVQLLQDAERYTGMYIGTIKRRYAKIRAMTPEQFRAFKEEASADTSIFEWRIDAMSMPKDTSNG